MKYTSTKTNTYQNRLSLIVFNDSLYSILYSRSNSQALDVVSLKDGENLNKSIGSILEEHYTQSKIDFSSISQVNLCFTDQNFELLKDGVLNYNQDRLPSLLYYHQEFFKCSVSHHHVVEQMHGYLSRNLFKLQGGHLIWFHLRRNILFISISKGRSMLTATSFVVSKTMDVFYYILFNAQSTMSNKAELESIFVSGDLLQLEELPEFLNSNFPDQELITPEDIALNKIPIHKSLYPYFPEIAIESL
ncbi:hypothetical protein [Membranihabitans marinus]|uniref:hypothetical protein n=1 Tax=Membranihabitans marinus TaxID=1227546 RepID=UPI001F37F7BD|nr:hypothetical protein [Membranihabitans marinus]